MRVDVGDFNEILSNTLGVVVFPAAKTFSANVEHGSLLTTIDGAVVADDLARGARAMALDIVEGAQHRPDQIDITLSPACL